MYINKQQKSKGYKIILLAIILKKKNIAFSSLNYELRQLLENDGFDLGLVDFLTKAIEIQNNNLSFNKDRLLDENIDDYIELQKYETDFNAYYNIKFNDKNDNINIINEEPEIIRKMKEIYKKKQDIIKKHFEQIDEAIDGLSSVISLIEFFIIQETTRFIMNSKKEDLTEFDINCIKKNVNEDINKKMSSNFSFKNNHDKFKQLFNNISEVVGIPNGCDFETKFDAITPYLKRMLEFNINKISNAKNKEEVIQAQQEAINLIVDKTNITSSDGRLQEKYNQLCEDIFNKDQQDEQKIDFKKLTMSMKI